MSRCDASPEACAAALASLPGIGPARLVQILREFDPREAWGAVLGGRLERPAPPQARLSVGSPGDAGRRRVSWEEAAAKLDVLAAWRRASSAGVRVTWIGREDFPPALAGDPHPPGVLFFRGSLEPLHRHCVAIVGTRSATPGGRAVAYEIGRDLTAAGVCVVSGLALGIDGSAHMGALDGLPAGGAAPVGVAASGVDVPYPKRHADLWERIAATGAVVSETPPGYPAEAWRFPSRNRIIAALVGLVVVVESHESGGSLITAEAAIERGVEVRVVPGPVNSPACAGSNQLLYDGAGPVRGATDVLDAIGMLLPHPKPEAPGDSRSPGPASGTRTRMAARPPLAATSEHRDLASVDAAVLAAVGWTSASANKVAERCALDMTRVASSLEQLAARGLVVEDRGWWTRIGPGTRGR